MLGTKTNFVPLEGASLDGDRLTVAYGKDVVKDAPSIDEDGHLTEQDEAELYRYYERQGGHGADVRDRDGVRDRDDLRDRGDGRARDDVHGDDLHDRERDAAWRGDDAGVRSDRNDAAAVGAAGAAGGLAAGAAGSRGGRDDEREVEGRNTNRERLLEGARDQKREGISTETRSWAATATPTVTATSIATAASTTAIERTTAMTWGTGIATSIATAAASWVMTRIGRPAASRGSSASSRTPIGPRGRIAAATGARASRRIARAAAVRGCDAT